MYNACVECQGETINWIPLSQTFLSLSFSRTQGLTGMPMNNEKLYMCKYIYYWVKSLSAFTVIIGQ